MRKRPFIPVGRRRDISLRQVAPNAVTAMALCFGLTGVRYAMDGKWELAVTAVILAGVLDGLDGRIARLLRGESRFGAELDSLSDAIAFGVTPALIIYFWSLHALPKFGWVIALAHALMCALRLARFNAQIDTDDQPHKRAGYLTGIPAPAGAGLAFVPLYCWFLAGDADLQKWFPILADWQPLFREWYVVAPWTALVAFLMISNIATFSWKALRLRRKVRLDAIAIAGLLAALLMTSPWLALLIISLIYLALIPFGMVSYRKTHWASSPA